jgi:hypothetical protein
LGKKFRKVKKIKRRYYQILFKDGTKKFVPIFKLKNVMNKVEEFEKVPLSGVSDS